jgi:hypothetical protein
MSSDHTGIDQCPSGETLEALSVGRLDKAEAAAIEEHLTGCDVCCRRLEEIGSPFFQQIFPAKTTGPVEGQEKHTASLQRLIENLKSTPVAAGAPLLTPDDDIETLIENPTDDGQRLGTLGHYELREEVARGGMGIVLKAFDPDLQRTVAIKLLAPSLASVPRSRDAFLGEARAAARLQHENVMPIYAVDQHGPLPYLVMPFVDGPNLQQHLDQHSPLDLDEIVRIGHQTCRALEEAHANGLVHRDVKPGNIMLLDTDGDRRVWLADFGLSSAAGDLAPSSAHGGPGVVAGTPAFMAPEQFKGEAIDHRADLFALGCVLYAMASCGRSPFHTDSAIRTMEKIKNEDMPSLKTTAPEAPDWLSRLVADLLEKEPNNRPQSAAAVRETLENHLPEFRLAPLRRTLLIGAGMLAIAVVASLLIFWQKGKPLPEGFLVGNEKIIHGTLNEAIEAARAGDTVIVRKSGGIEIEPISIPAGKALNIRAASGYQPVFLNKSYRTTILQTEAPLCLEGLEFQHPFAEVPGEAEPILRCGAGPVFLANCRFVRSTTEHRKQQLRYASKPLIQFVNCPQIEVTNCEFYMMSGTDVVIDVTEGNFEQSIHAENNLFLGQFGVRLESMDTNRHAWNLDKNTFVAAIPLSIWSHGQDFPDLTIHYERNLFDSLNCLLELRDMDGTTAIRHAIDHIALKGTANFYRRTDRKRKGKEASYVLLTRMSGGITTSRSIETLEEFSDAFGPAGSELDSPVFDWSKFEEYGADLSLMTPDLFEPEEPLVDAAGFDRSLLGPGEAYRRWQDTDSYKKWSRGINGVMR